MGRVFRGVEKAIQVPVKWDEHLKHMLPKKRAPKSYVRFFIMFHIKIDTSGAKPIKIHDFRQASKKSLKAWVSQKMSAVSVASSPLDGSRSRQNLQRFLTSWLAPNTSTKWNSIEISIQLRRHSDDGSLHVSDFTKQKWNLPACQHFFNEVFMANFQLDPQSYQVIQAQAEHQDVFLMAQIHPMNPISFHRCCNSIKPSLPMPSGGFNIF